jgi:DUF4097 and DUF4098 domain-containing protein YvlB
MKISHLGFSLGIGLLFLNTAMAKTVVDESRPMAADGLVSVENLAGSVEFTTWERAEVKIEGELGDDVKELEIIESSTGIRISVKNDSSRRNVDESHLRLQIPQSASVEAESVSADLTLKGSQGVSIDFNSVSGDLNVEAKPGRLELESVSGDVEFHGQTSRASIETVSGEIEVLGVDSEVRISTVSGDAKLSGSNITSGRLETVSGDLRLELELADGGRLNAESMSGDVYLKLPASQQADFSAMTFSGDIRTDFGAVSEKSRGPGSSLTYREGSNGASIDIESFSGDIHIQSQ